jgi:hypothetical protein
MARFILLGNVDDIRSFILSVGLFPSSAAALGQASVAERPVALPPVNKGASVMATAAEYHQYARECLEWADEAESEDQRKHFLGMARAWTQAALRLEGLMVPLGDRSSEPTFPRINGGGEAALE